MSNKETMAIIATSPLAIKFFLEFIISEFEKKYSIIIMTNTSDNHDILRTLTSRIKIIDIKIKREINLISDIRTAFILMKHLSAENISVVYSITPKAGFIGILVSKIMKVPVRIHNFTGQVWKTKKGLIKHVLKSIDRLIYLLSTRVIVDSHSQREFLINNNIIKRQKSIVIGDGSISGVDIDLFSPNQHVKQEIREQLKTKSDAIVFLYIGRLSLEKGIIELIKAYSRVADKINNTSLWIVGPNETKINNFQQLYDIKYKDSIHFIPYTPTPERYMMAADICCLPSHREGFGSVIIESASCGVPAIGTKIYGLTDAIVHGVTGLLVEVKNIEDLSDNMILLAENSYLRKKMGKAARRRVVKSFDQRIVVKKLVDFIDKELR